MSLASLLDTWTERHPAALAALDSESAGVILAALPKSSTLDPETHADALQVALVIAACRLADGHPVADSVGYGWTAALGEARRYPSAALDSETLDPYAETYPERTTLSRSETYSPDAPYRWSVSDTLTVALSLVSERSRDLFDILSAAPAETYWGALPERDTLAALAALSGVRLSPRTARREVSDALAEIRHACSAVTDWLATGVTVKASGRLLRIPRADGWTPDARTLAERLAETVAERLDCRGTLSETGTPWSGPASGVVVRYRDTLADAWQVVTETETLLSVTESGEPVATERERLTLQALTESGAADTLADPYALEPYRRTRTVAYADAYAERLSRTAGAVRKGRSRKGSRVGSTGPTVPIGSRSGGSGAPLGLALGTFTVHPVTPIPHPVTERAPETERRITERLDRAAHVAERDATLSADPIHVARVADATERARLAARALAATDTRPSGPAAPFIGPRTAGAAYAAGVRWE